MAVSESGTYPETFAKSRGRTLFRWNIQEEQVTDPVTGEVTTKYVYDEVAIEGNVTKAKILEAMRLADIESADSEGSALAEYEVANTKLAKIADLTYAQLDSYIDKNVTDLPSAKVFLKDLAAVVLAVLKRLGI